MFWKKKIEPERVVRAPFYVATANGMIVPTFGEQPVKAMTVAQALAEADRIEIQAHNDYRAGFTTGADYDMDIALDLRAAIQKLQESKEPAPDTLFYF